MADTRRVTLVRDAIGRKADALVKRVPRWIANRRADELDRAHRPPVIVTTLPKSGTHLVHQVVSALPGIVDYGTFLVAAPSWARLRRRGSSEVKGIAALAPGEVARAHLRHEPEIVDAVRRRGAFVVFVHRDPRDVVVSASHYLANSAPWHVMHGEFARRSPSERIDLGIDGLEGREDIFPDISERCGRVAGWLDDADVVLRFEDLVSTRRDEVIEALVTAYAGKTGRTLEVPDVVEAAVDAIDPSRSHTFRAGRVGEWRESFTTEQARRFDEVAGATLERYGYPLSTG